jgi:regulatory protein
MEDTCKALASAFRTLTYRDHSEAELRRKLQDKGFSGGEVEAVIEKLRRLGYLDDKRFAEQWAESAIRNGRGYGPRLRIELLRRGVPDSLITDVLAKLEDDYGEKETLAALAARKFSGFDPASADDREKRRVINYLRRRGFSLTAILMFFREQKGCRGNLF